MYRQPQKKSKKNTLFRIFMVIVLILFHHIAFNTVALAKINSLSINNVDMLDTDLSIVNLEISNEINPNTLKITWNSIKGANFYIVYYRDNINKKWKKNVIPRSNYTVIDGLLANTKYEIIAKACTKDYYCNQLTPSKYITTQKVKEKISCNEDFIIEENGILSVRIEWESSVKAKEYIIKMQKESNQDAIEQIIYRGQNKIVTLNNLDPNMEYKFSIDACYENKECIELHKPKKIIMAFKPITPNQFAINVEDLGLIKLAWEKQIFISYYNIYVGSDTEKNVYSIKTSDNNYTFKNMANNVEYFFWLRSCNKRDECSELTEFQSIKAINTQIKTVENKVNEKTSDNSVELSPPKDIYTKLISDSFIELHWSKISDVSNYIIKHSFKENEQLKENFYTTNKTKYTITNYKSYQHQLAAIKACSNEKNCSKFSKNHKIQTLYDTKKVNVHLENTSRILEESLNEIKETNIKSAKSNLFINEPEYIEANNIENKIDSYVLWQKVDNAQFYNIYFLNTANNKSKHIKLKQNNIQNIEFSQDKNQYNYYYIDVEQSAKLNIQQEQEYNVWVQACFTENFCSELSNITSLKIGKIKYIAAISKAYFLKKKNNKILFVWSTVKNKNIIYKVYQTTDKRLDGKLVYSGRRPSLDISSILDNKPNYFYVQACENEICSAKSKIIYLNKEKHFFNLTVQNFLKPANNLVLRQVLVTNKQVEHF